MKSGGDKGITEACYMYVCWSLHWPAVPTCLDLPALREVGPKECDLMFTCPAPRRASTLGRRPPWEALSL